MKTVLITGANKGIGFETAKHLAQLGYYVYMGSRNKEKGLDAIKKLNASGVDNVEYIELDVTDIRSVKAAKEVLETKVAQLDVLINNAGIAGEQPQNFSICDLDILRRVFETNVFGVIQTTQQFLGLLKKSNEPVIINVSSELGSLARYGSPSRNPNWDIYNSYSSSKTALNAITVMLANDLRNKNFKINSVCPGYTATDLNQFKGTQTAEQAANTIVKYVTSENIGTGKYYNKDGEVAW
jgi:NAD(P)-dependent dehydrogenase (short-subunit alcohol dehydrogenase family)